MLVIDHARSLANAGQHILIPPGGGNEAYSYSYLFAYELDLPAGATTVTLPDNAKIRILAATVAKEQPTVNPAQPLYDRLDRANTDMARWKP